MRHGAADCPLHPIGVGDVVRLSPELGEPLANAPGVVLEVSCTGPGPDYWLKVELPNDNIHPTVSVWAGNLELIRKAKAHGG
jgi:hypothetical protein